MNDRILSIDAGSLKSVIKSLESLPIELQKSAERAVLRSGAAPIQKAVKARVPVDTGLLKKSIGTKVSLGRAATYGRAQVGPRSGFHSTKKVTGRKRDRASKGKRRAAKEKKMIQPEEYAFYLEHGTPHMPAKPFIRPAIDAAEGEVLAAMATGLDKHLTRVAARMASKKA
jgi:HK97 gp10 family phage protein